MLVVVSICASPTERSCVVSVMLEDPTVAVAVLKVAPVSRSSMACSHLLHVFLHGF